MLSLGTLKSLRKGFQELKWKRWRWSSIFIFLISLHAFFSYWLPLHCDFLYLSRLLFLESWRKLIKNILEQSVEATGEVFLSSYWSIGFRLQYHLSLFNTVHNFQVLHRVVILIFCWPIQTTPLRLRSR